MRFHVLSLYLELFGYLCALHIEGKEIVSNQIKSSVNNMNSEYSLKIHLSEIEPHGNAIVPHHPEMMLSGSVRLFSEHLPQQV